MAILSHGWTIVFGSVPRLTWFASSFRKICRNDAALFKWGGIIIDIQNYLQKNLTTKEPYENQSIQKYGQRESLKHASHMCVW